MLVPVKKNITCGKGFTLIELLISMAVSGIVLMTIFTIYKNQQQHYSNQLAVTSMQQNIRGAFNLMSHEIRMAGFDTFGESAGTIKNVKSDLFYFTFDLNEDGDVTDAGEHIAYDLYTSADGKPTLGRTTNNSTIDIAYISPGHWGVNNPVHQPVAENIEHLEFFYLDENGNATTEEDQVQTVVVTLVARAQQPDPKFHNTLAYNPASNLTFYNSGTLSGRSWVANDNYRRRLQTLRIECRNVGLE